MDMKEFLFSDADKPARIRHLSGNAVLVTSTLCLTVVMMYCVPIAGVCILASIPGWVLMYTEERR